MLWGKAVATEQVVYTSEIKEDKWMDGQFATVCIKT